MCQTDLPGSWNHPSSDQCRPCCCMMHVSERSLPDQRLLFIYHPHNTVDFRYLHTLLPVLIGGRIPAIQLGCHCLSTAGRTDQQQIMTSCHRNLCCPSDIFLSTEISKIWKTSPSLFPAHSRSAALSFICGLLPLFRNSMVSFKSFTPITCIPSD